MVPRFKVKVELLDCPRGQTKRPRDNSVQTPPEKGNNSIPFHLNRDYNSSCWCCFLEVYKQKGKQTSPTSKIKGFMKSYRTSMRFLMLIRSMLLWGHTREVTLCRVYRTTLGTGFSALCFSRLGPRLRSGSVRIRRRQLNL